MGHSLHLASPDVCLYTDAFNLGWEVSILHDSVNGRWTTDESFLYINFLELRAFHLGLSHFMEYTRGKTVAVFSNNATALSYLAKEGDTCSGF